MYKLIRTAALAFIINTPAATAQELSFKVADTFHIKSGGGWDYILADAASNKLYVTHGTQVNVLNKHTGD
jgi:hypothetical protein